MRLDDVFKLFNNYKNKTLHNAFTISIPDKFTTIEDLHILLKITSIFNIDSSHTFDFKLNPVVSQQNTNILFDTVQNLEQENIRLTSLLNNYEDLTIIQKHCKHTGPIDDFMNARFLNLSGKLLNLLDNPLAKVILEKLHCFKNLTNINLSNNNLSTIPVEVLNIAQLQALILDNNNLENIKGIDKLVNLDFLSINDNKLNDIEGIEKLVNVHFLRLNDNKLTDIKGIDKLVNLEFLGLSGNKLSNINSINCLTKLLELFLNNNCLANTLDFSELVNLEVLHIECNKISDIVGIQSLVKLEKFICKENNFSINFLVNNYHRQRQFMKNVTK